MPDVRRPCRGIDRRVSYAALIAGLGTLSGPAHGGQTAKPELLEWRVEPQTGVKPSSTDSAMAIHLGFGHPFIPKAILVRV